MEELYGDIKRLNGVDDATKGEWIAGVARMKAEELQAVKAASWSPAALGACLKALLTPG